MNIPPGIVPQMRTIIEQRQQRQQHFVQYTSYSSSAFTPKTEPPVARSHEIGIHRPPPSLACTVACIMGAVVVALVCGASLLPSGTSAEFEGVVEFEGQKPAFARIPEPLKIEWPAAPQEPWRLEVEAIEPISSWAAEEVAADFAAEAVQVPEEQIQYQVEAPAEPYPFEAEALRQPPPNEACLAFELITCWSCRRSDKVCMAAVVVLFSVWVAHWLMPLDGDGLQADAVASHNAEAIRSKGVGSASLASRVGEPSPLATATPPARLSLGAAPASTDRPGASTVSQRRPLEPVVMEIRSSTVALGMTPNCKQKESIGEVSCRRSPRLASANATPRKSAGKRKRRYSGWNPDTRCCLCSSSKASKSNDLGICDGCDMAYHQLCHYPPVSRFPANQEPWYCNDCTIRGSRKKRRWQKLTPTNGGA